MLKEGISIAIIGTRGIPNNYGGFEQFAEYLSVGLVQRGCKVTVYNSHSHPFQDKTWNGVDIVHCNDPENKYGTIGQFIYDFNCILDTRRKSYDIILQLGYTSSSIWWRLLPKRKTIITTNMDGLEWKRTKFSKPTQLFLRFAEKLAIKHSDYLISDSIGIQKHISDSYGMESTYIPYGSHVFSNPSQDMLRKYNLVAYEYNMLIARLEPENSIELILDGVVTSKKKSIFLVIGNHKTKYGEYLKYKFKNNSNIVFLGGIYDIEVLNNMRYYSNIYFHGHTVGGTNPSLLEAMGSSSLICAQDNIFNKSILKKDAYYFKTIANVSKLIDSVYKNKEVNKIENNLKKINKTYSWKVITDQYLRHFKEILNTNS